MVAIGCGVAFTADEIRCSQAVIARTSSVAVVDVVVFVVVSFLVQCVVKSRVWLSRFHSFYFARRHCVLCFV